MCVNVFYNMCLSRYYCNWNFCVWDGCLHVNVAHACGWVCLRVGGCVCVCVCVCVRRLMCSVCQRDFKSLPALNGHMRSHGRQQRQTVKTHPSQREVRHHIHTQTHMYTSTHTQTHTCILKHSPTLTHTHASTQAYLHKSHPGITKYKINFPF